MAQIFDNGLNPDLPGYDPAKAAAASQPNYAPLPQITQQQQPAQDPITTFNLKLWEMLGQAQNANSGNPVLAGQKSKLELAQNAQSTAPASQLGIENLRPGDMLNARQNASQLYNPEVRALNDRMQLNNEAVDRFTRTIQAAQGWGEEYAKHIKPDEQTIEAVRMQMRSGIKPDAAILEKVSKYLTQEDWDALVAAEKEAAGPATAGIAEYEYAKAQGYKGTYQNWLDAETARNKSSSGGGGAPSTVTERLLQRQEQVINEAKKLPRGENGFANPNDYLDKASDYLANSGDVNTFLSALAPQRYLSPSDAIWVIETLTRKKSSEESDNPFV